MVGAFRQGVHYGTIWVPAVQQSTDKLVSAAACRLDAVTYLGEFC